MTFDAGNWDQPQTVTIAAAADADLLDGSAGFIIRSDNSANQPVITVTENDNVVSLIISRPILTVVEGGTATFTVELSRAPLAPIDVTVTRDSGDTDLSVSAGASLTFDAGNWDQPQTVTIAAAEDADMLDGSAGFIVQSSNGINQSVVIAIEDDNEFTILVSDPTPVIPEDGQALFSVTLSEDPQGEVTVNVAHTSGDADLSIIGGATLTFDADNWSQPQVVTVAAAEDADAIHNTAELTLSAVGAVGPTVVTASESDNDVVTKEAQLIEVARNVIDDVEYSTYHLLVSSDADWTNQHITVTLTSGTIFYHEMGNHTPQSQAIINIFPDLEWDTYLTSPLGNIPSIIGFIDTATSLDSDWFKLDNVGAMTNAVLAQITVTTGAVGTVIGEWYQTNEGGVPQPYSLAFG